MWSGCGGQLTLRLLMGWACKWRTHVEDGTHTWRGSVIPAHSPPAPPINTLHYPARLPRAPTTGIVYCESHSPPAPPINTLHYPARLPRAPTTGRVYVDGAHYEHACRSAPRSSRFASRCFPSRGVFLTVLGAIGSGLVGDFGRGRTFATLGLRSRRDGCVERRHTVQTSDR